MMHAPRKPLGQRSHVVRMSRPSSPSPQLPDDAWPALGRAAGRTMPDMPDLIIVAIISAVGGIVGGIIGAVTRPWIEDKYRRGAETRKAGRDAKAKRVGRVEHVVALLTMSGHEGPSTYSAERGLRELPAAAAAVDDAALSEAIGRMVSAADGNTRESERSNALRRAGTLLAQADRASD